MKRLAFAVVLTLAACARPEGLDEARILEMGTDAIPLLRDAMASEDPATSRRALDLMARITGQWGSDGTGIVWKRSMAEAVEAARETGKPIMMLHIFGKLDEEFC